MCDWPFWLANQRGYVSGFRKQQRRVRLETRRITQSQDGTGCWSFKLLSLPWMSAFDNIYLGVNSDATLTKSRRKKKRIGPRHLE